MDGCLRWIDRGATAGPPQIGGHAAAQHNPTRTGLKKKRSKETKTRKATKDQTMDVHRLLIYVYAWTKRAAHASKLKIKWGAARRPRRPTPRPQSRDVGRHPRPQTTPISLISPIQPIPIASIGPQWSAASHRRRERAARRPLFPEEALERVPTSAPNRPSPLSRIVLRPSSSRALRLIVEAFCLLDTHDASH